MLKVLSGGQTGADRAALDAALEMKFPVGGYCPAGRIAEDGAIASIYPLTEIEGGYPERTLMNIQESDATLIFHKCELEGGTKLTAKFCEDEEKAFLLIDIATVSQNAALGLIMSFLTPDIEVLNIAGPRQSKCPEIYDYVLDVISRLIYECK